MSIPFNSAFDGFSFIAPMAVVQMKTYVLPSVFLHSKTRADFVTQLLWFTPQCKAISKCRQRKFSQPVIQNKQSGKNCPETNTANFHLVRAKGGF